MILKQYEILQPGLRSRWEKRRDRPLVGQGSVMSRHLGKAFIRTLPLALLS